jgi:hypothetical protein
LLTSVNNVGSKTLFNPVFINYCNNLIVYSWSPKIFPRTYQKKFSGNMSFSQDPKIFLQHIKIFPKFYVLPEFRIDFCPTVKILRGTCQFSSRPSWESPLATSIGKSPSNGQYMG